MALILSRGLCSAQVPAAPPSGEGTVRFATSCQPRVSGRFNRAVALLHSFAFAQASRQLNALLRADPQCAMAYWALALSAWGNPFAPGIRPESQLRRGLEAVELARRTGRPTERERSYIEAVAELYQDAGARPQPDRLRAYREAMARLVRREPADTEARIFYALAVDISADPSDKSFQNQQTAAQILEPLFASLPTHPGLAHYLIHTYDIPALASRGIPAARQYAQIAPAVSHALHMPSHIFTRVGMWRESIEANTAAAVRAHGEGSIAEELHAMDYQTYAYLQGAMDSAAARLLAELPRLAQAFNPALQTTGAPPAAGYYALAAIPARYALERGQWTEASRLGQTRSPVPYADGLTAFARALGGARAGDTVTAAVALAELQRLRDTLASGRETYWAEQLGIAYLSASAWLLLATGHPDQATAMMRTAAEREAATEKSAVSPGPLAPAHELLGEMLLSVGDSRAALEAFERSLAHDPGRLRSLAGALAAAVALRDGEAVRLYREQLAPVCARSAAVSPRDPPLVVTCQGTR